MKHDPDGQTLSPGATEYLKRLRKSGMESKTKLLWDQIIEYRRINALLTSMDKKFGVYDEDSRGTADLTLEAVQEYMVHLWPELKS